MNTATSKLSVSSEIYYYCYTTVRKSNISVIIKSILFVSQMEFNETKWSCSWNSDKNYTQNFARGWWGSRGWVGIWLEGVVGVQGVGWLDGVRGLFDMKLTLSVRHNCLKLKMII